MSLLGNLQPPPEPEMRNGPQVRLHYHWWELPQVSFLSRQTRHWSQQKYACRYKTFVVTKLRFSPQNSFVTTKDVFWLDKDTFVATKDFCLFCFCFVFVCRNKYLSQQKCLFFAAKICLTRQAYFCRDNRGVVAAPDKYMFKPPVSVIQRVHTDTASFSA